MRKRGVGDRGDGERGRGREWGRRGGGGRGGGSGWEGREEVAEEGQRREEGGKGGRHNCIVAPFLCLSLQLNKYHPNPAHQHTTVENPLFL